MRLPINYSFDMYQGFEGIFKTLYAPGNYSTASGYTITFGMKSSKSNSTQDLTKVSTSSLQLVASYANGRTTLQLKCVEADTLSLTSSYYYYEIWASKSGERTLLFEGTIDLNLAVVKNSDSTTTLLYSNFGVEKIWGFDFVTADESIEDVIEAFGFDGVLSVGSLNGNELVVTSTEDDFDYRTLATGNGVQGELVDANNYKIYLDPNKLADAKIYIEIFKRK